MMNKVSRYRYKKRWGLELYVVFTALTTLLSSNMSYAQDSAVIELRDTVTGNQEQPKVLYIVPWQAANDDTILYQAPATKLQLDVFGHVDRPEHLRELKYLNQLSKPAEEN